MLHKQILKEVENFKEFLVYEEKSTDKNKREVAKSIAITKKKSAEERPKTGTSLARNSLNIDPQINAPPLDRPGTKQGSIRALKYLLSFLS